MVRFDHSVFRPKRMVSPIRHQSPPDCTDLNPIEMPFATLKALIRKAAVRTFDQVWQAVGDVCDLFTNEERHNFYNAAG